MVATTTTDSNLNYGAISVEAIFDMKKSLSIPTGTKIVSLDRSIEMND